MPDKKPIRNSSTLELPHPFGVEDFQRFFSNLPNDVKIGVVPIVGGTQRDPETIGYRLHANWEVN